MRFTRGQVTDRVEKAVEEAVSGLKYQNALLQIEIQDLKSARWAWLFVGFTIANLVVLVFRDVLVP